MSSTIGLERQLRGKSAGLRAQSIAGTSSALIVLISKYGFAEVLSAGKVVLDPSRVAAQIVSGIGFLGAGLIIMRGGAVRGLTTAASIWESAAIGLAAGAGLTVLAMAANALHFVIMLGLTPLRQWIFARGLADHTVTVTYLDGQGVLRDVFAARTANDWAITSSDVIRHGHRSSREDELVSAAAEHLGDRLARRVQQHPRPAFLGTINGVTRIDQRVPDTFKHCSGVSPASLTSKTQNISPSQHNSYHGCGESLTPASVTRPHTSTAARRWPTPAW